MAKRPAPIAPRAGRLVASGAPAVDEAAAEAPLLAEPAAPLAELRRPAENDMLAKVLTLPISYGLDLPAADEAEARAAESVRVAT